MKVTSIKLNNKYISDDNNCKNLLLFAIYSGIALRIAFFIINLILGGNNVDEVLLSVNAKSISSNLTDITGERLPLYFDTWIKGGQSPLPTYIVALFVKIFGLNLFAVRLPSLLLSIISLIFAYFLSYYLFSDNNYKVAFIFLCSFSPWLIYSGIYTMDCNYLGHFIVIALAFLLKGINTGKGKYFVFSMLFFSACLYSYIASVLIIPIFLITLYLSFIICRRISIKNIIISVLSMVLFSMPFIMWGLVVIGKIEEFNVLGFSFHNMPGYLRANDTIFASNSISQIIKLIFNNWISLLFLLIIPDVNSSIAFSSNIFLFSNLLGGIFVVLGIIKSILLKRNKDNTLIKIVSLSTLIAIMAYTAMIKFPRNGTLYRYSILSYLLLILASVGMIELFNFSKSLFTHKKTIIYSAASLIMFNVVFFAFYMPQTIVNWDTSDKPCFFADPFYKCLNVAEEHNPDKIAIYKTDTDLTPSVYLRYYYDEKEEFGSLLDEVEREKERSNNIPFTKSEKIICDIVNDNPKTADDDVIIVNSDCLQHIINRDSYHIETYKNWSVLYK